MKVSLDWLRDYIQLPERPEKIAQLLTQSGLEVMRIATSSIKENLEGLVIGQVIACEQHPSTDLTVMTVHAGQESTLSIVCRALDVQPGQKIAVALTSSQSHDQGNDLPQLRRANKGEETSGKIHRAESEIELDNTPEQIIVLDTHLPPGTPAIHYFENQPDSVLEIDLTPNRADACSHLGIARELGALLDRPVHPPSVTPTKTIKSNVPYRPIQVEILDQNACPRYSCTTIQGIKVQPSPLWLKKKLQAIEVRPINNVVDVTNLVMHELGQPLHAFDYDQIIGKSITAKQLEPGTSFVTPEGISKTLNGTELMICDQVGGISMAGIVGSQRTSICSNTRHIFLESAYFAPETIRKTARYHTLRTDASFRYERGTDPNLTSYALERACLLMQDIAQGENTSIPIDIYPKKVEPTSIKVHYKNIRRLLGRTIPKSTVKKNLHRLGIEICHEEPDSFVASIPTYRVDVKREVDVIEEIARICGYDHLEISGKLSSSYLGGASQHSHTRRLWNRMAALLASSGYHEICTNSLTASLHTKLMETFSMQPAVALANPLSAKLNALRNTLLFGGLEVILHNINRKQTDLKLFERGRVYHKVDQQYVENDKLGVWITGNLESPNWIRKSQAVTFQELNTVIYKVLHTLGITDFTLEPFLAPYYRLGIQVRLDQTPLLTAGSIHQRVLNQMKIGQPVFFADVNWDTLLSSRSLTKKYRTLSKFPLVRRDISLVLEETVSFGKVKNLIRQHENGLVKEFFISDVYKGKGLKQGKKAYTLSFILQEKNKTLDEVTIDKLIQRLTCVFAEQLGAIIRP